MILVTGANGHLGSQTIDFLLEQDPPAEIAGLVRSKEKGVELKKKGVEIKIGDYNDYDSLLEAMDEPDTLLFISSSSLKGRVQQHQNVIDAAEETGISHIFYTSILLADDQLSPLAPDHEKTETFIKDSGIDYTIYRNTFYGEFLPMYLGDALETGDWYFPSDGEEINLALRSEIAEGLAAGLFNQKDHVDQTYEITSGQAYSLDEIADLLSKETGKEITYHDIPIANFKENLEEAGLPNETIMMSMAVATTFVNGGINYTDPALSDLLGREPAPVEGFLPNVI
jgi:NAD(P)H dehydrogenase (quinone)